MGESASVCCAELDVGMSGDSLRQSSGRSDRSQGESGWMVVFVSELFDEEDDIVGLCGELLVVKGGMWSEKVILGVFWLPSVVSSFWIWLSIV